MKKLSVVLVLLCITLGANAQLLWKVSGNGLKHPSYVFGTHHFAPLNITERIGGLSSALNEVGQVYGEIVMEEMLSPQSMQKMQQAIVLPGDTTLHTLYTPAQYDSLATKIKSLMGVELQQMDKLKPAFLYAQITALLAIKSLPGYNPQQQLDGWVQAEAKKQGKPVGALETVDLQMKVLFSSQSLKRQAEVFYATLMNINRSEQQMRELNEAYINQNLDSLDKISNQKLNNASDPLPEEIDAMVVNRNLNWVKNMPSIMQDKATLFAVGALHLTGEKGILQLLKKQGYTIEEVK